METAKKVSKGMSWTSYVLQGIVVLMFLMGAITNLMQTEMAVEGAVSMGYPEGSVVYLGVILLIATVLYAIPKTMFIGALLLTAWLGGAVATHIIHGDPMGNTLFPVIFGIVVWASIMLRNTQLRALF
ncbi:DoxX-like family protein [Maribacter sedimenticola]|uniref:DoxX-like family protein n=1 Tax=Maribacter sedimenticola TaxID=228956 RepID=A0ABY1SKX6_9FLAO|nr:DoxX family protein [Maribacter sedimenticola]SNR72636.1 DoxX-like family protein [Maribacter sedimenticola]